MPTTLTSAYIAARAKKHTLLRCRSNVLLLVTLQANASADLQTLTNGK